MKLLFTTIVTLLTFLYTQAGYIMGDQGESCNQACYNKGLNCNPVIETNNRPNLFYELGIACVPDPAVWSSEEQPCFISDKNDPNFGKCRGYFIAPDATQCSASSPAARRLCNCDEPSISKTHFGTGFSAGSITTDETWIFSHTVAQGDVGVLNHFWITYLSDSDNGTIIRYYIDGEKNASIEFTPSLLCGVGFYDTQGPWGTNWFGKGADDAAWWNNFNIPFQKSIVITMQHQYARFAGSYYVIARGQTNLPIVIGGRTLPKTAKMNQFRINQTYQPLDWVPLVNVTSGPGAHFMVTLAAHSGNLNFLEGCLHAYFDGDNAFPGVVLSTGTEDYFDSAWYFNGGQFHLPVSGFTHLTQETNNITWSAYRFHDTDPLFFNNGFQLVWRNGDMLDLAGMKCYMESGGPIAGAPTASDITAYGWAYTWPASEAPKNAFLPIDA